MQEHPHDPHWPNMLDPNFQEKVNTKYELQNASLNHMAQIDEMVLKHVKHVQRQLPAFVPLPEQTYSAALLSPETPVNATIMYWDTGTGKTKGSIMIAENFKKSKFDRCIIISKNKAINHWRKELMSSCTNEEYVTEAERALLNLEIGIIDKDLRDIRERIQEKINARIRKYYTIIGHTEFVNKTVGKRVRTANHKLQMKLTDDGVMYMRKDTNQENLENVVLIIDEAHHMMGQDRYDAMFSLLKNSKNVKLVMLTATCMYNEPYDIARLLNLCLLVDNLPLLPTGNTFMKDLFGKEFSKYTTHCKRTFFSNLLDKVSGKEDTLKEILQERMNNSELVSKLKQYIQIYMTTVRKQDKIHENGFPDETIVTIPCYMSKFQSNVYMSHFKKDVEQESLYLNARIASICVGPDGSLGSKLNKTYFQTTKNGDIQLREQINRKYFDYADSLRIYSCKVYECTTYILNTLFRRKYNSSELVHYANGIIFSELKKGVIDVQIQALKSVGFRMFDPESYFENRDKKPRKDCIGTYLIITGDTKNDIHLARSLELFNSYENRDGSIITLIIGTEAMSESIDLKRVYCIMIFSKWWNHSRDIQLIGRGSRRDSHIDVPYGLTVVYFVSYPTSGKKKIQEKDSIDHVVDIHSKWKEYMQSLVEPLVIRYALNNKDILRKIIAKEQVDMSSYVMTDYIDLEQSEENGYNFRMSILGVLTDAFQNHICVDIKLLFDYIINRVYNGKGNRYHLELFIASINYIMANNKIITALDPITGRLSRGYLISINNQLMFSSYLKMHNSGMMIHERLLHYDVLEVKKQPKTQLRIKVTTLNEMKQAEKRKTLDLSEDEEHTPEKRKSKKKRPVIIQSNERFIPNEDTLVSLGYGYRATMSEKGVFRILRPDNIRYNKNLTSINKNTRNSGMNVFSYTFKQLFDMTNIFELSFMDGLEETKNKEELNILEKKYIVKDTGKVWTKAYLIHYIKNYYLQRRNIGF